jgi:hypothetical protein
LLHLKEYISPVSVPISNKRGVMKLGIFSFNNETLPFLDRCAEIARKLA